MGQGGRIKLNTGACFAIAVAVYILPLWFLLSFVIAAMVHEICHYIALKLSGVKVYQITIGPFGASMETDAMDPGRELVCAIAGPFGSLMLVPLCRWLPVISFCGLIQGMFNLLPIYPLDGGRILQCALQLLKISYDNLILQMTEMTVVLCILGFGIWMKVKWNLGWGGVLVGAILLLRILRRKTPCKECWFGVQ